MLTVPWYMKIALKLVLARFPASYGLWQKIGIFKHGGMEDRDYAFDIFQKHFDAVTFSRKNGNFVALELGPGDSLFSALLCSAHNASATYLIDSGNYANKDIKLYYDMKVFLEGKGLRCPDIRADDSFEAFLRKCNAWYGTGGLASFRELSDESADFIWSNAVLEHVKRSDFLQTLREMKRVLKADGVSSHRIDLRDHLGNSLHNLRFSEKRWEGAMFASSGFYTNRIRFSEMVRLFEQAGFDVHVTTKDMWPDLPLPRKKLAPEFSGLSEEDLRVSGFNVILTTKSCNTR